MQNILVKTVSKKPRYILKSYKLPVFKTKTDYKISKGRRRRIVSSAVTFRTNSLSTRTVRATGILRQVPMCFLVIRTIQLSFMVNIIFRRDIPVVLSIINRITLIYVDPVAQSV
jgi:hypothetical protein